MGLPMLLPEPNLPVGTNWPRILETLSGAMHACSKVSKHLLAAPANPVYGVKERAVALNINSKATVEQLYSSTERLARALGCSYDGHNQEQTYPDWLGWAGAWQLA